MATVTGFEGLRHTRRAELKQFSELFVPLFAASSDDARRQAAAALSRCDHVPAPVALQIGSAPISIAAIFLTRAPNIDEATLLHIIRSQSPAHATAIARRDDLSPRVIDALVSQRQTTVATPAPTRSVAMAAPTRLSKTIPATPPSAAHYPSLARKSAASPVAQPLPASPSSASPVSASAENVRQASPQPASPQRAMPLFSRQPARAVAAQMPLPQPAMEARPAQIAEAARLEREEKLRAELTRLTRLRPEAPAVAARAPLSLSPFHEALLVRFARSVEVNLFTASLSAALGCGLDLAERIVLDVSGLRLATALSALEMPKSDTLLILGALYPHLSEAFGMSSRADALLTSLPADICRRRVETWLQLEAGSAAPRHEAHIAPDRAADSRMAVARPIPDARTRLTELQQAMRRR